MLSALIDVVWPMLRWGPRLDQVILPTTLIALLFLAASPSWLRLPLSQSLAIIKHATSATIFLYTSGPLKLNFEDISGIPDIESNGSATGLSYTYRGMSSTTLWQASLPVQWPTFAEYSEPPIQQTCVSDTGRSIRAFLPFGVEDRQLIRNYSGKALVLDTRVTCQKETYIRRSEVSQSFPQICIYLY